MQLEETYTAHMLSWDDLRFFLAVHRGGNLAEASRRLRVDATTVSRRMDQLEQELGTALFVRRRGSWSMTPVGERILRSAEVAERAVADVDRIAAGGERAEGRVRVTTLESVATYLIAPSLPSFYAHYPDIQVDLTSSIRVLDLERGEADLAVRLGRPQTPTLKTRRLATIEERPYAARSWLAARGVDAEQLIDLDGAETLCIFQRDDEQALRAHGAGPAVLRTRSATTLLSACASGAGVALLPDLLAASDPRLVPLPALDLGRRSTLWLVFHEDVGAQARVRALMDHLVAHVQARTA